MLTRQFLIAFIVFSIMGCSGAGNSEIRQPAVAGAFYPAGKRELSRMINSFLNNVPEEVNAKQFGQIYGMIVPHAGYVYSGQVAAYGFRLIEDTKIDTVVLIGQSHNFRLDKSAVYVDTAFRTPLGDVPIDRQLAGDIVKSSKKLFEKNNHVHKPEHSLEVELPFLQTVLSKFRIVPILIPQCSVQTCEEIAAELVNVVKKYSKKRIFFVISTDMSHYPSYKDANIVDKKALGILEKYDPTILKQNVDDLLSKRYRSLACVFCGEEAVYVGMYVTKMLGANNAEVIHYANSGDVGFGDKTRVVGYCAVAFTKEEESKEETKKMEEFSISQKNQKILLELARKTIHEYLESKKVPPYETTDTELLNPSAVFVTLNKNHQLRGCIGTTVPQLPLYQTVQRMAVSAAFEDYRFNSVTKDELKDIKIEISVLSPLTRVKSADEIKENIHGVIVRRDGRSGLFLPQVWEHFTKKEDFLSELCRQKAHLNPDAWKDDKTELYIFTVFAFEEAK